MIGAELTVEIQDLGGGLNEGLSIKEIQDNQATKLQNWYTFGSKLKRRGGSDQLTESPYSEALTSLFAYKVSTATWLLLVGTLTGVCKLDGTGLVPLHIFDRSTPYASEPSPWHFRQYKGEVLAARKNTGSLKRVTADGIQDAGIPKPVSFPTLADGGAGVLVAGVYGYVVTFSNQTTGSESNPSDVVEITVVGTKKNNLTNIPVSDNGQVNARRIYRTIVNQTGEYFFVAQLDDNFTTTYTDNVAQDDLEDAVSFDNGMPPSLCELVEIWRERSWVSDGVQLNFSQPFKGQGFGEFDFIEIYPDDGHKIRGLLAYGDRLVVGKTNAIHFIIRAGERFAVQTLSDKHGLMASHSLKTAEGLLFWYAGDNVYRSEGVNVNSISTVAVRKTLDSIPEAMKENVIGYVVPSLSQYRLSISTGSLDKNDAELYYNYKTDSWSGPHAYPAGGPTYVGDFFDSDLSHIVYGVFSDAHVYQLNTGTRDGSTPVTAIWRDKARDLGASGKDKAVRRVNLRIDQAVGNVTVRLYNDGKTTPSASQTVSLNSPDAWKRIAMPDHLFDPGTLVQTEVEYSGVPDVDLEGVMLEAVVLNRRGPVL